MMRCLLLALFAMFTLGCADSMDESCLCHLVQHLHPLTETAEWSAMENDTLDTSDSCALLTSFVTGIWQADLPVGRVRYEFGADGQYRSLIWRNGRWARNDAGTFWLEYNVTNGLYRAELHLAMPDADDYPVLFYVRNGQLCMQEHMGDSDLLVFDRIS